MTLITLKFTPDMEEAILQGRKCCTTRDEQKGNLGDLFVVKDRVYRLLQVDRRMHPYECTDFLIEGFESFDLLKSELERFYPQVIKTLERFSDIGKPGEEVYVHFFAYVGEIPASPSCSGCPINEEGIYPDIRDCPNYWGDCTSRYDS